MRFGAVKDETEGCLHESIQRVVTALATASLVVTGLLHIPVTYVLPAMILLVALVHLECSQMIARRYAVLPRLGVAAGVAYLLHRVYGVPCLNQFSLLAVVFFAFALRVLFDKKQTRPIEALAVTTMTFVYIPVLLSYFVLIPKLHGVMALLYVIALIKFSDMGGFALGLLFGRHKLCPSISPNKTWEGLFGSLLAAVLMTVFFKLATDYVGAFSWGRALAFAVAAALVGTLGDLVESRMKRECEVKDSATFMPAGLGGFLDMFDSLVFAPALFFPFL
jgi:phosphatidate cytidylyltransferase